jgi:ribosomal protein L30/L7E
MKQKGKHVQIKWVKSGIGFDRRQRATLPALGLAGSGEVQLGHAGGAGMIHAVST